MPDQAGRFASDHEPHPDCPDTLACLTDTESRPQHTLPVILRCAILGSPNRRLTIREIYAAMEAKYPYYKTAGPTWKQSVRHHLSLNRLFERQPRPVTDPGFGSYWTVNLTAPPGTKRPRKRGRSAKDGADGDPAPPKKRGRPHKMSSLPPTRGSTPRPSAHDGQEDVKVNCEGDDFLLSEDDCESEEELIHPYDRRDSLVGLTSFVPSRPPHSYSLPPFSSINQPSESLAEHMQDMKTENATLRRQSAEAVVVSLRLSEQLSQAQAEVTRSRSTVRDLEDLLEEEILRRRNAERTVAEEGKRRRIAEEALAIVVSHSPDRNQQPN